MQTDRMARLNPNPSFPDPRMVPGMLALPADWPTVFGRRAPLVVELGSGGGRYLIGQAQAHPERDFIAVEQAGEYLNLMAKRVIKRRLTNMRLFRTDAADLIESCFPDECVDEYHIYFPDPWPKKRHHKRRLFTPAFCTEVRRTLAPAGTLFFATDHSGYFEEIQPLLQKTLNVTAHPEPWEDAPDGRTNYEIKYLLEGRPIFRLVGRKERGKEKG